MLESVGALFWLMGGCVGVGEEEPPPPPPQALMVVANNTSKGSLVGIICSVAARSLTFYIDEECSNIQLPLSAHLLYGVILMNCYEEIRVRLVRLYSEKKTARKKNVLTIFNRPHDSDACIGEFCQSANGFAYGCEYSILTPQQEQCFTGSVAQLQ